MSKTSKKSIPIEKIVIGMSASIKKVIEFDDIKLFAKLSGDTNAIHLYFLQTGIFLVMKVSL